ncbi:conserved hypothetical protein [Ricinus communis]|uniref:Reverse transcriptase zinc-binding domain-containing protein n=1 Tax=Ricinus communis TaxID=3988 RepID=B9RH14_RICCO|nr:conserved hypothetical protein [Ricinus communis]
MFQAIKAHPKVKVVVWKAYMHSIPTLSDLYNKRVNVVNICPFCQGSKETSLHLFVDCPIARDCWSCSLVGYSRINASPLVILLKGL